MKAATIGVISVGQDAGFFAGRYFREILTVASQVVVGRNCHIRLVTLTHEQSRSTEAAQAVLTAQQIDAALLVAPSEAFLSSISDLLYRLPSIVISAPHLDIPWSYVSSDNYGAMRQIVAHLAGLGYQRIRLIQPSPYLTGDYWERARGYNDVMHALGFEAQIGYIAHPITDAMIQEQVLVGDPQALITPSDNDALAMLSRLQRRGMRVPADIALVGFDDEDFAADTYPALTTVSQPLSQMARNATNYLLDRLAGEDRGIYQEVLPNRLVVRESCGANQVYA
jgi:DNA-binding LacI/PurR family transcriptional regulator